MKIMHQVTNFLNALKQTANTSLTENGAVSNASTLDPLVDFFARAGALRSDVDAAVKLFQRAFTTNPRLAVKALFYLRDIRGGQGERKIFRACLALLPKEVLEKVLPHVAEYGRWDDLLELPTSLIAPVIEKQLAADTAAMQEGKTVSLLAKWLPSENTSSHITVHQATSLAKALHLKPAQYRKALSALRKHIKLLEHQMSTKAWQDINYEVVPSQAHRKHVKAFKRNDKERYQAYLEEVVNGTKKIKTSTLYTYEVFEVLSQDAQAAEALWRNLPDYTNGTNALVVADVSGSMSGRPMSVSVSLALYFAERNQGPFHNYFMTFSENPKLQEVVGETLAEKFQFIQRSEWGMSTDLEKAFMAILAAAQKSKATQQDLPQVLYVISDMEFNSCTKSTQTNFENAKALFVQAGYQLPHVVFWNVNARNQQFPATIYDQNVTLISGSSQHTFKYAVEGKTPTELMHEILLSERYARIEI